MSARILTQTLAEADSALIIQLSDTHLTPRHGVPETLQWLLDAIRAEPPDLMVVTGDVVEEDPDDAIDRAFAHEVLTSVPCPVIAIPGNHDIGFYDEVVERDRRIAAFVETWGADRFCLDVAGWRLVGANAYLLGESNHDIWLHDAVTTALPVAVFVHQPVGGDPADGWEMPPVAREAFERSTAGADIRHVISGHRHRSFDGGRIVWAPSTTFRGPVEQDSYATDPTPGAVSYSFNRDGTARVRFVRP